VPIAGLGIALWFELPPLLAAGLVIIAACPGGMFSNVYVHVAKANTALSVTLTATATTVTLFTLPLWIRATIAATGSTSAEIDVPLLDTALGLGGLTVAPIAFGMFSRAHWPGIRRGEKWLTRIGVVAIVSAFVRDAAAREDVPIALFQQSIFPVLWLLAAMLVIGLGVPLLFRLSIRDTATIGVEIVVKNSLLGLVLARASLEFDATLPILAFAIAQTPLGIAVLAIWRWLEKRRAAASATARA
jgi:BASS family bile acid:Na+ symporter